MCIRDSTVSLRLTNTYGPRMRIRDARQTFIGWWFRQLLEGQTLNIFGDGLQVRDFNYVDDVIEALLMVAFHEAADGQIYGRPEYLPVDERHPLQPADVNGINKLAGEWYHMVYHQVYGLRTVSLRLTNTYGPRMRIRDARQTFIGWWLSLIHI